MNTINNHESETLVLLPCQNVPKIFTCSLIIHFLQMSHFYGHTEANPNDHGAKYLSSKAWTVHQSITGQTTVHT